MEGRLPALAARFSRTIGFTLEILQHPVLAEELHRGLADLAEQLSADLDDRVYVRIALGSGWLEGWYSPADREIEPISWISPDQAA